MQVNIRLESGALLQYLTRIPTAIPKGVARGLNRAGAPTSTRFLREAKKALGIGRGRGDRSWVDPVKKYSRQSQASAGRLRYLLVGFGNRLPLKYFNAQETRRGVSATPMGVRRIYAGSFQKGGLFPKRVDLRRGNTVFRRLGKKRLPIEKQFGPAFPEAFSQPVPIRVWEGEGGQKAMAAIYRELDAILKGHAPK